MWRLAFLSLCFSFQQPLISSLTPAPLPVALWCRGWAVCLQTLRDLAAPAAPSAPLSFPFPVICACCSFVAAIELSRSFLPRLMAAIPSPGPPLPREQPCLCLPSSAGTWVRPRPSLSLFAPLAFLWSHSPLWVIAFSDGTFWATSDTHFTWATFEVCCQLPPKLLLP